MHIVFLVNNFPPGGPIGGIVTYTELMAKAWQRAGHRVTVLCQSQNAEREESHSNGVHVIRIPSRKYPLSWIDKIKFSFATDNSSRALFHKELSWAFYQEISGWSENPDLVEAPDAFGWSWAIQEHMDIPVVVRVHGPNQLASQSDPNNPKLRAHAVDKLETWCMKRAAGVFPPTNYMATFIQRLGVRVTGVVPLAFESPKINLKPQPKIPYLVTIGRLIPGKGIETALRMLPHFESMELKVIGPDEAVNDQKSYKSVLENLARELKVDDRVDFLGSLPREQVLHELSGAQALIHDSSNDNMPYVILEALSLNVSVLASKVGGIPETLEDRGCLIENGDVAGYVNAIRNLKFQETAKAVAEKHDPQVTQQALESAYRETISTR